MRITKKSLLIVAAIGLVLTIGAFTQGLPLKLAVDPKVDKFTLAPDFTIEHLYSSSDNKQGSWAAMTFDDQGRMLVSDHYGAIYRLEIPAIGASSVHPSVQQMTLLENQLEMGYAQGLLWAHHSLYAVVSKESLHDVETGLYRLQDTNNDDQF